ncbi:hypothetical protein MMH89_00485 [Candidatus Comchoanobacter bicostacola]|uniref:Uncharacterized protein n=1 Tax=Candidatus Comchoanobacter bicostacola TaxID=2919598 RepID=A0ABY5DJC3_9GAMM|nr:hypothetical protein [Candidatus Comchoanobacter bicostacola]UTC24643.1 hypothetical protein MMH89_00485 [Candidatus Comchoanobacter bicostacola]
MLDALKNEISFFSSEDALMGLKDKGLALSALNLFVVLRYQYEQSKSSKVSSTGSDVFSEFDLMLGSRKDHMISENTLECMIVGIKTDLVMSRITEQDMVKIYGNKDFMIALNNDIHDRHGVTIVQGKNTNNPSEKAKLEKAKQVKKEQLRKKSMRTKPLGVIKQGTIFYKIIFKQMSFFIKVCHFIKSLFTAKTVRALNEAWVNRYVKSKNITRGQLDDMAQEFKGNNVCNTKVEAKMT